MVKNGNLSAAIAAVRSLENSGTPVSRLTIPTSFEPSSVQTLALVFQEFSMRSSVRQYARAVSIQMSQDMVAGRQQTPARTVAGTSNQIRCAAGMPC